MMVTFWPADHRDEHSSTEPVRSTPRVDYIEREGSLVVLELEPIEPYLGLERSKAGVDRFVSAVTDLFAEGLAPSSQSTA